jgi:hypothetical protein
MRAPGAVIIPSSSGAGGRAERSTAVFRDILPECFVALAQRQLLVSFLSNILVFLLENNPKRTIS